MIGLQASSCDTDKEVAIAAVIQQVEHVCLLQYGLSSRGRNAHAANPLQPLE